MLLVHPVGVTTHSIGTCRRLWLLDTTKSERRRIGRGRCRSTITRRRHRCRGRRQRPQMLIIRMIMMMKRQRMGVVVAIVDVGVAAIGMSRRRCCTTIMHGLRGQDNVEVNGNRNLVMGKFGWQKIELELINLFSFQFGQNLGTSFFQDDE